GGDPQMRAHIAANLPVIAQPAEAGRYGCVFTEIKNAVGLLFEPAVMAQGVKPFHVRGLSQRRAIISSTISPRRCSLGTEISRSISPVSGRPITDDQTARPAKKPDAPACMATLTARGNNFSSTPEERITHGMAMCSFSFCEAASSSCCVPLPNSGISTL